jgi:hypothetical protein
LSAKVEIVENNKKKESQQKQSVQNNRAPYYNNETIDPCVADCSLPRSHIRVPGIHFESNIYQDLRKFELDRKTEVSRFDVNFGVPLYFDELFSFSVPLCLDELLS